jgi:hypothetical protein
MLVKSEVSLFRCVALVSLSVCSIIAAYKLAKDQNQTDTWRTSQPPQNNMLALKAGQTIIAVIDRPKGMRFHVGNDVMHSSNYE